nr:MAG TPA: hypothetical protein [Caudoviricetes sp.]
MAVTGKLFYLQTQTKVSIRFDSEHRLLSNCLPEKGSEFFKTN